MILTCPSCTMRYLVADGAVGPAGRKVRCAHCGNQWFQAGEDGLDEELFAKDAVFPYAAEPEPEPDNEPEFEGGGPDDFTSPNDGSFKSALRREMTDQPIPEGVRPTHDEVVLPTKRGARIRIDSASAGFVAAALFYMAVLAVFFAFHGPIARTWPASNLLYRAAGLQAVPPGEGLALGQLHAELGKDGMTLSGEIANLRRQTLDVPAIMASMLDEKGKIVARILIAPPVKSLKAEGSASFSANYAHTPNGAKTASFAFSYLKPEDVSTPKSLTPSDLATPPQNPVPHH